MVPSYLVFFENCGHYDVTKSIFQEKNQTSPHSKATGCHKWAAKMTAHIYQKDHGIVKKMQPSDLKNL